MSFVTDHDCHPAAVRAVRAALRGHPLIWFGIRGQDARALACLPEFAGACCITAPLSGGWDTNWAVDLCLERLRGSRPDLDRYDVDFDDSVAANEFAERMRRAISLPCALMPYRASALASRFKQSRGDELMFFGMTYERQRKFEHKPWVERALAQRGIRHCGWRPLAVSDRARVQRLVATHPHVVRVGSHSGGVGLSLVRGSEDIERLWPANAADSISIAPFVSGVPINFSGCVFAKGELRLHPASIQLIGIGGCTDRPFGYCGNDFGGLRQILNDETLNQIDMMGRTIGTWLANEGYRGAFGVDGIVTSDEFVFCELNARFQGSSPLSARIARELDVPDLYLDHIVAMLGHAPAADGLSIAEWTRSQPDIARIVLHNTQGSAVTRAASQPEALAEGVSVLLELDATDLPIEPGGALCSATFPCTVTHTGFVLTDRAAEVVDQLRAQFVVTT